MSEMGEAPLSGRDLLLELLLDRLDAAGGAAMAAEEADFAAQLAALERRLAALSEADTLGPGSAVKAGDPRRPAPT
ncbi:hypothetical protein [Paracraurococcus lichenis]|uniref:Uncharacterized protein n=1 Tax=Paracraurococcus lichenis TaxID=3064888 RepID=A0ABT9EDR3_9PROT|nr:hypothetical protein [Paracraurococcus sp. LOR1-02]MDO9714370.1 hypothetical protein [Paracraurococcus sp. LOR1-02]